MIQNSFGNSPTVIVFKRFQHLGFKVGKMDFWGLRNGNGNFTILTKIHLGDTMILDILGNNPISKRSEPTPARYTNALLANACESFCNAQEQISNNGKHAADAITLVANAIQAHADALKQKN
ncbi:uncharacterized protein LOC116180497 isoform X2 [Photinus pyralis]|uniref:uncharacterized protein LOC116180497 isoform X2 n=1 Tax=Photinus pyralis TaxID=7054 RepID=UPI001267364D|nr:uncharacterized protein LOC116180497 isoform X2 [Photinus pyralis]